MMGFDRAAALQQLETAPDIPVLIIGAGINGVGLYRELCLQGIDAVLVDRADFCAGASAAPSRMIHGGLRYLENGEFRLVRESLHERDRLLENAAHYVHPLPTTIPIFAYFSGLFPAALRFLGIQRPPANRGALVIKIGLALYDFFADRRRMLSPHSFSSRAAALKTHPALNPKIVGTATYYDAWIASPERLCVELMLDGDALNPYAKALNYVSADSVQGDGVLLRDELTGKHFQVKPQVVVNAGGAWIDRINQQLNQPTHFIGGTKGSHLMIDNAALYEATNGRMIYYENADGRVCILFPLLGKVLVGSTDIPVNDPDAAVTAEADIDYMLDSVKQVFPQIKITRSEIVFHFVGVRPLPHTNAASAGQISRDHRLERVETGVGFPIYAMIGGKWTTFRAFAEQTADAVLKHLHQPRRASSISLPIGGGKDYPVDETAVTRWVQKQVQNTQLTPERMVILLQRYGTRAQAVAQSLAIGADRLLTHHRGYSVREIEFLVEVERVVHLDDLILRRTTLALQGELNLPLLNELAEISGRVKGWTMEQNQGEVDRSLAILRTKHGVHLPMPQSQVQL